MTTDPAPERISLYVLTPEDIVFEGQVLWVQVPLEDGLIGIWPGHSPLVAAIGVGDIVFDSGDGETRIGISHGILRVSVGRCAILIGSLGESAPQTEPKPSRDGLFDEFEEALEETLSPSQIKELQSTSDERH